MRHARITSLRASFASTPAARRQANLQRRRADGVGLRITPFIAVAGIRRDQIAPTVVTEFCKLQDAAAQTFAEALLPTVRHHLQAARTLASEQGMRNARR